MLKKIITLLLIFSALMLSPAKALASKPPSLLYSTYTSPASSIPADGITTGTITINLKDSDHNFVTGDNITLFSSNDSKAVFNNNQITGASGNATFTITSTTVGITKVTLKDITNAATFTDWFTVTFYPATLGCTNVPAAPILTGVTSNSSYTATLTWADSPNPVSNYLVAYGLASGKYIYGKTNIGAQGTTAFTVGSLSGNKKYYFAVAASNNCGASGYSNEMSVVVKPLPATPKPTPVVTATPVPTVTPQGAVSNTPVATPTGTPEPVITTPTPETATAGSSTLKTVGTIFAVLGFVIIGFLLAILIMTKRKKQTIPPPVPPNPLEPPTGEDPPQII